MNNIYKVYMSDSLQELIVYSPISSDIVPDEWTGFISNSDPIEYKGFQLHNAQSFITNFLDPRTTHKSLLVKWQTGTGKSIAAISIAERYISIVNNPHVVVLSYTGKETLLDELIKNEHWNYKSETPLDTKRNILKKNKGYYTFYGYKEFLLRIFNTSDDTPVKDFNASNINNELFSQLDNALIIADEVHNTYNKDEYNIYGSAILYVLRHSKNVRFVMMTATPMISKASEIVNIISYLHPEKDFAKIDFFDVDREDGISIMRSDTLDKLKQQLVGYVSFMTEQIDTSYPKQIFMGEEMPNIPLIKVIKCQVSDLHSEQIKAHEKLTSEITTLYDMVFPGPYGALFSSENIYTTISSAPYEWQSKIGITVGYNEEYKFKTISGTFLRKKSIGLYSAKYAHLVNLLLEILADPKSGKVFIFHPKIKMSGITFIANILKENGFIESDGMVVANTRCAQCGIKKKHHESSHTFVPVRFLLVHGLMNRNSINQTIAKFNMLNNLSGNEYKLLLASKVVREGYNFKAIKHMIVTCIPSNYPTLQQVLGRAVRKNSHMYLPLSEHYTKVYILMSYSDKFITHEHARYIYKGKEYLTIQQVESMLLSVSINHVPTDHAQVSTKTFYTYNYSNEEVTKLIFLCKLLFAHRTVWTFNDLYNVVIKNPVPSINYNFSMVTQENLALAVTKIKNIVVRGKEQFLIWTDIQPNGKPYIDYQVYVHPPSFQKMVKINLNDQTGDIAGKHLYKHLDKLPQYKRLELTLIELPRDFHIFMVRGLITGELDKHINDVYAHMYDLYVDYKVIIGKYSYFDLDILYTYVTDTDTWESVSQIRKYMENDIVIGILHDGSMKIRKPIHKTVHHDDKRKIEKGSICETQDIKVISKYINQLNLYDKSIDAYVAEQSFKIKSKLLCLKLKLTLMLLEHRSDKLKWVYMFNESAPAIY